MSPFRHQLLVIDDEPDVLETVKHLFHRTYRVLTASSGAAALEILRREDVHLILCDQRMPGMTGDVVLAKARELQPDAVRILFTGYADLEAVILAVNQGHIFRYVNKPWDPEELAGILQQATDYHDLRSDRHRLIRDLQAANVELTHAIEELAEAAQLKQAFLEVASHEFNTPITLVLGLAELLKLTASDPSLAEQQIIDQLCGAAKQLGRLVGSTLTLMHADEYRKTLTVAPVPLANVLHEAIDRVAPFVQARNLNLDLDISGDLGNFEIDADKISSAVVNVLSNAIKFTADGGTLALSARLNSPDEATITMTDHGVGLEPKSLERIFEPFFTEYDPSRHSSGEFGFGKRGLGVGLAIVKQFVELHGGHVGAQSQLGQGTVIRINLPRHLGMLSVS